MMRSIDGTREAEGLLSTILDLLSEDRIRSRVIGPIDAVGTAFLEGLGPPDSPIRFNQIVASFMQAMHAHALPLRRSLAPEDALAEGLRLLRDVAFQNGARGYVAACLMALDPGGDGIRDVLAQMAERLKGEEQRKYTEWVFFTRFRALDWNAKVALTEVVLRRLADHMPEGIAGCGPAQLAGECPSLILLYLRTEAQIGGIVEWSWGWPWPWGWAG